MAFVDRGHTNGHRDPATGAVRVCRVLDLGGRDIGTNRLRHQQRAFDVGRGQDHREFLATETAGEITGTADTLRDRAGNPPQGIVAGDVSGGIVECLEFVDIQNQ